MTFAILLLLSVNIVSFEKKVIPLLSLAQPTPRLSDQKKHSYNPYIDIIKMAGRKFFGECQHLL